MIISHKHKFVFVKTRKTAGSTFEKLIRPYLGKDDICTGSTRDGTEPLNCKPDMNGHVSIGKILENSFIDEHSGYDYITIERNPYDKVVSSYYWHQTVKSEQFGNMDFETYVKTCNLLPVDWGLYTIKGEIPKHMKIFKYEDMTELYMWFKKMRGVNLLDKVAQTRLKSGYRKVKDYKELHTDITQRAVEIIFDKELKEFGYEF